MGTTAHSVADVVLSVTENPELPLINLVHPHPVPWNNIFQLIADALPQRLPLVPFSEWLAKVDNASKDTSAPNLDKIVSFPSSSVWLVLNRAHSLLSNFSVFCTWSMGPGFARLSKSS